MAELTLEVRLSEFGDGEGRELLLLIDGEDRIGLAWGQGGGRDPDTLLGPNSPLLPSNEPHEVILMRCGCGIEGCGSVIGRISRVGNEVVWDDLRSGPGPDGDYPTRLEGVSEFRFALDQYLAELERADRHREWESPERRAARCVREKLADAGAQFANHGFAVAGVWPVDGGYEVSLLDLNKRMTRVHDGKTIDYGPRQIVVRFLGDAEDPEERATQVTTALLESAPSEWNITFDNSALRRSRPMG